MDATSSGDEISGAPDSSENSSPQSDTEPQDVGADAFPDSAYAKLPCPASDAIPNDGNSLSAPKPSGKEDTLSPPLVPFDNDKPIDETNIPPKERPGNNLELVERQIVVRIDEDNRPRLYTSTWWKNHSSSSSESSESDDDYASLPSTSDSDDDAKVYSTSWDLLSSLQREAEHSEATREWMDLRDRQNGPNKASDKTTEIMNHIMARVGNEPAKKYVLSVYRSRINENCGSDRLPYPSPHVAFTGNMGTGRH
jgi:hypothetical protein